jgi:hypothetical protein
VNIARDMIVKADSLKNLAAQIEIAIRRRHAMVFSER